MGLSTSPSSPLLAPRYVYGYGYGYSCDSDSAYYSGWYCWGRWVLCGVLIAVALLIFFIVACTNSRRRRARGRQPVYGTAWMAPGHGPVNYYGNNGQPQQQQYYGGAPQQTEQAPPQYAQPTGNSTAGYYGNQTSYGQQNGVELQQPPSSYQRGGDNVYSPPAGPPPGKH